MGLITKIAFRNLWRHKGRSLSIGFILIVGTFFMTLGDGTLAGLKSGLDRNFIKGIFGDVTLMSRERQQDNLSGGSETFEYIGEYESAEELLAGHEYVDRISPIVLGAAAMLDLAMTQSRSTGIDAIGFWGIDPAGYENVYSRNIEIVEGGPLKKGERGILINAEFRKDIYLNHDVWLSPEGSTVEINPPGDALSATDNPRVRTDLVLMGLNGTATATDVRVPIRGIFRFRHIHDILSIINRFDINFVDITTARDCMGYMNLDEMVADLSPDNRNLLDVADNDPDAFFAEDDTLETDSSFSMSADYLQMLKSKRVEKLSDDSGKGVYNLSQVNLKPGIDLDKAVALINSSFAAAGLDRYVRAVSWKDAWTDLSGIYTRIHLIVVIFVNILYLVVILMIANSLSMAAMERTTELATMRTVGSRRSFVMGMFLMETSLLSLIFGGIGIILGIIVIKATAAMNITASSPVIQILFGGSRFAPVMDIKGVMDGIVQLGIVTAIAAAYPIAVASKIRPLDAIPCN